MGETGTHPNAEAIRRGFEAFMRGDVEAARSLFAPDVVWHVSGHGPLAGDFHGFDDIARWGGELVARSGGTFREELLHVTRTTPGATSSPPSGPSGKVGRSRTGA